MFGDPLDESMEGFDVRDVLAAQAGEARAKPLVEANPVRGEAVPQLPRETTAADVPVCQDDCFAVGGRNRLAKGEDRRALVDHPDVAEEAEGAEGSSVILALDDDRDEPIFLRQFLEHLLEILFQPFPIHRETQEDGSDKGCAADGIK
jgi:hypothetical protein